MYVCIGAYTCSVYMCVYIYGYIYVYIYIYVDLCDLNMHVWGIYIYIYIYVPDTFRVYVTAVCYLQHMMASKM